MHFRTLELNLGAAACYRVFDVAEKSHSFSLGPVSIDGRGTSVIVPLPSGPCSSDAKRASRVVLGVPSPTMGLTIAGVQSLSVNGEMTANLRRAEGYVAEAAG